MSTRPRRGARAGTVPRPPAPRVAPRRRRGAGQGALRVLVLSGPNLDRLGKREPQIYGTTTLTRVHEELGRLARELGVEVTCRQSNHEGLLIDWINAAEDEGFSAILLNPGALTHTSYALYDSVRGSGLVAVEVHVTNPDARESFRRHSTAGLGHSRHISCSRFLDR